MRIAILATGPSLDAEVDPRFGRCSYFIIADPETMQFEALENPNAMASGGTGISTGQMIVSDRVSGVCHHFAVPVMVCINKYDLNEDNTRQIENYCYSQGIGVASRIPFDNVVTEALVQGLPVVEYSQNRVAHQIERLWQVVSKHLT